MRFRFSPHLTAKDAKIAKEARHLNKLAFDEFADRAIRAPLAFSAIFAVPVRDII
ncbi:MAG TPA: hypothetical protein VFM77_10735 [Terriglobales bacterium]|nr:hypothetical protein [Terriglobales bacterium]